MRVLCCGSRDFDNMGMIIEQLSKFPPDTTIIEGEAKGADTLCRLTAESLGFAVEPYPAEWDKYGKRAGLIRNKKMIMADIDLVLAFRKRLNSRGTNNTLFLAKKYGIPAKIFDDF